ncbi:hypothetical protein [Paenibacillus sp. 32352]|uniref:hypothetical protein n=1 Tax=Paenibacillus sp. 32352 TaxID=1969111 RepID=UPI00118068C9|nr:hypothetical protein [Paenibacillus sp. 32352]
MMNHNNKRKEILEFCEKAVVAANEIQLNVDHHVIIKKMAQQIKNRVEIIEELCSVEKYNLYFNGKVGLGKSTTICNLLNLIDSTKLLEDSRINQPLLLKTGSGRTTVCETKIIPNSNKSYIEIEKVESDEFEKYLNEFCKWLDGEVSDFSEEESRVIKNMCEIPLKLKTSDEVNEFLKSLTDNKFNYLLNTIAYKERVDTVFNFPHDENDFNVWLKNTYESINDGKIKSCPMPSKILVYICEDDLKLNLPEFIDSVIDTRGIDGVGERSDIQKYLTLNNSISLMCDEVNGFGGNESILSILKQVLIKENKDIKYRTILLGLEKGRELDNITDFEGNRSEGMASKLSQAQKKFTDNSVYFENRNMFFTNSAPGLSIQDSIITKIDLKKRAVEQEKFFKDLREVLERMYANYYEEVCDSLKTLNQLANGKITQKTIEKFISCRRFIEQGKEKAAMNSNNIVKRFEEATLKIYHASLRGAVNHNGIGRTADVYATFQRCGGEEFSERCHNQKEVILALINETFENCDEMELTCYQSIIDEINKVYSRLYTNSRNEHYDRTRGKLYNDTSWSAPKEYWGDRIGSYNKRVTEDIIKEIKKQQIDAELINLNIEMNFFDEILEFLKIS